MKGLAASPFYLRITFLTLAALLIAGATPAARASRTAHSRYGVLQSAFVANVGQFDHHVLFASEGERHSLFFRRHDVVIVLSKGRPARSTAIALRFVGANANSQLVGQARGGQANYLVGRKMSAWRTGVATYMKVVYRQLWPGVDMEFRESDGRLKYEFILRPGVSPSRIRLAYAGIRGLSMNASGDLTLRSALGTLIDRRPASYQQIGGRHEAVSSRFSKLGGGAFGFAVGKHEIRHALVIDPGLVYSTFLGGSAFDGGMGIAVDGAGSAYVIGRSNSVDFPTTLGAVQTNYKGNGDVFVAKLNSAGSALVYSTFLGGSSLDEGRGIAVDASGNAHIDGFTDSPDFPVTPGAADPVFKGNRDGFVAELDASGRLVYSTFLGGSSTDNALALTADAAGNSYVTGETSSPDFPTTSGAFQTKQNGGVDAYIAKLAPNGHVIYSTFLGGPGFDDGLAIAVDASGNAFATGKASPGFPVTPGAYDTTQNGGYDLFITKLNSTGSALVYSTYLGGSAWDEGLGIAVDSQGSAYVTGNVQSPNFPTTPGAYERTMKGPGYSFVTKLNQSGSGLIYSTFLGGASSWNEGDGLAIDSSGDAYVAGHLASPDYPTTPGAIQTSLRGPVDAFLTKLNPSGSGLLYSTYLGGSAWDGAFALAVDAAGAAYLTGFTQSSDFPTNPGAFDRSQNGDYDAFVTKIDPGAASPSPDFTLSASPPNSGVVRGNGTSFTVTVNPSGGFNSAVALDVSGLPVGATASFVPNPAVSSSTLTIQTATSTPPGGYPLTIRGVSGSLSRTTSVQLDVHCCG